MSGWDDFPPGGLHASSDIRKAMSDETKQAALESQCPFCKRSDADTANLREELEFTRGQADRAIAAAKYWKTFSEEVVRQQQEGKTK